MNHDSEMDSTETKLNTSQVSRRVGIGRATVARHAKAGKISYELDEQGHMLFDASEINRVYSDKIAKQWKTPRIQSGEDSDSADAAVQQMQSRLISQYESRIAHLEQTLDKTLEVTLLLEDRSQENKSWESSLQAATENMAAQTHQQIKTLQQEHEQQVLKLRRALKREIHKPWWQKLLERGRVGASRQGT